MKILILDDSVSRQRQFKRKYIGHEVTQVYTALACVHALQTDMYDAIFLDHDLGGQQMVSSGSGTGFEVAEYLSKNTNRAPEIIFLHSLNTPGTENMKKILATAGLNGVKEPFLWKE